MSHQTPVAPQAIKLPEVRKRTTLGRTSIWRRIKAGTFPKPFLLGGQGSRAVAWLASDIDAWLANQAAKRGR
jgi:prophage regulatory protein